MDETQETSPSSVASWIGKAGVLVAAVAALAAVAVVTLSAPALEALVEEHRWQGLVGTFGLSAATGILIGCLGGLVALVQMRRES